MAVKKNTYIRIINGENHLDKDYYTYAHVREDEHLPFYIGIGTQNKNSRRFTRSKSLCGRSSLWKNKLKNKQYYIIICTSSNDYNEIKQQEIAIISEIGKIKEGGLLTNITDGGEGCQGYKHTQQHIIKLREDYKRGLSVLKNRKVSNKERLEKSINYTGKGNPNFGKRGINSKTGIVIEKISLEGDVISEYGSLRDAGRVEGVSHMSIIKAIKNNTLCRNFKWRHKNGN